MRHAFFTAWILTLGLSAMSVAQEIDEAGADAEPPVIADEPKSIDPATLMPEALAKKASIRFDGESLLELAGWFKAEHGLTVVFDKRVLDDVGVALGEPIVDRLDQEPLYLLLNRLSAMELAWYFEGGLVTITSEREARNRLVTRPYNLGDLLDAGYDRDRITNMVISTIASETWAENGGGQAEARWLGDVFFVSQNAATHRRVGGFFAALRKHGRQTFIHEPPQNVALREKLSQQLDIDLRQTPLIVAAERLSELAGVDLRLHKLALDELGLSYREPVSLSLQNASLETVLRVALRELELTVATRDGVLWITTEDRAANLFKTALYDVRDLCRDEEEGDALIDAVISQVAAETWAENGGGEAEILFAKTGLMVVSHTEEQHGRLLQLLERYRDALRQSKPREEPGPDPDEVLTHYYRMPKAMGLSLGRQMRDLVAPQTWTSDKQPEAPGEILMVESQGQPEWINGGVTHVTPYVTLVITQKRAVHTEIVDLISKVRVGDEPTTAADKSLKGGGGGFGGGYFSLEPEEAGADNPK